MKNKRVHVVLGAPKSEKLAFQLEEDREDFFVGVDRGSIHLLEEGVQPDLAIGDFDSIDKGEREKIESQAKVYKKFPAEKDDTDAELALEILLTDYQAEEIFIYNWQGGRLDHLWSLLFLPYQDRYKNFIDHLTFTSSHNVLTFYQPGSYQLSKHFDEAYLSFILLEEVKNLSIKGVKYPLENATYTIPRALISNEFLDNQAQFSFKKGLIGVIQSKDNI